MAAKPLLIALEPFRSEAARRALERRWRVRVASPASLRRAEPAATALFVKLRWPVNRALLARFPDLRWIVSPTTGLTHIDLAACRARGVEVLSLRGETAFLRGIGATAELTWALILAAERNLPDALASVRRGSWDRDPFAGGEVRGKTLGVIGLGRLGTMVARTALAFGMRVLYADPRRGARLAGARRVALRRLLAESDIVTLHADARPENEGMLGRAEFAAMKRRPLFVNTARGELVDEGALLAALKSGRVRGAALDVLRGEYRNSERERRAWLARHPLAAYARRGGNLLLTPHIGGLTRESAARAEDFAAAKLLLAAR